MKKSLTLATSALGMPFTAASTGAPAAGTTVPAARLRAAAAHNADVQGSPPRGAPV